MKYLYHFVLMCQLALLSACNPDDSIKEIPDIQGEVELLADHDQLRNDGMDAITFTVIVTDGEGTRHDVTEYSEIYESTMTSPLSSNVFTTDKEGVYEFYAIFGMNVSPVITVTAIDDVPVLPEDPQEDNLSFRHRMLLIQHTGTGCVNCPRMMGTLRELAEDVSYNQLYHHVASHSYQGGEGDAASSKAAVDLSAVVNPEGLYPMLTFNLTTQSVGTDLTEIKSALDILKKASADVGIAASAKVSGDDVLVNVELKPARSAEYRVAAWLLEDEIYSLQTGMSASWHNTHDNALRFMAGVVSRYSFIGEKVGKPAVGEKVSKVFVLPVKDSWDVANCEVLVFVTSADADGRYDIVNCALCQVGDSVAYEYVN